MKIALVYDRINKLGGAERVLIALHEIWPKAPLYTAVYNPKKAAWADVFSVKPSLSTNGKMAIFRGARNGGIRKTILSEPSSSFSL